MDHTAACASCSVCMSDSDHLLLSESSQLSWRCDSVSLLCHRVQLLEPAAHLPLAFFCLHFVARLETEREVLSLWKIQLYFRALTVKWCNFSSLYCCLYCRCSTVMDSQNKDGSRESYELKVLKISMCRKIAFLSSSSFPWFLWGVSQTPASVHDFSLTIAKSKWS